jgi:hypothetical protein
MQKDQKGLPKCNRRKGRQLKARVKRGLSKRKIPRHKMEASRRGDPLQRRKDNRIMLSRGQKSRTCWSKRRIGHGSDLRCKPLLIVKTYQGRPSLYN